MYYDDQPGYCPNRTLPPRDGSKQAYVMRPLDLRRPKPPDELERRIYDRGILRASSYFTPFHTFKEEEARKDFAYKMFALLSCQYIFVLFVIIMFLSVKDVMTFCKSSPVLWQVSGTLALVLYLILALIGKLRRLQPYNFILISILVGCLSLFFSSIIIFYDVQVLIYAFAIETAIVVYITTLAKFAPCDVAGCPMIFCVLATVLSVFGVIASIIWLLTRFSLLDFIIAGVLVTVLTLYLMFDTQVMMDNEDMPVAPDEFVKGNIHLYVDIFLLIVHLITYFVRIVISCFKKKEREKHAAQPTTTNII